MPGWKRIIVVGGFLLVSLGICVFGANFIVNFQYQPGTMDAGLVGVILFFIVVPVLVLFRKSFPGIVSLIAFIIRIRRP
jgi:hypothetical protein